MKFEREIPVTREVDVCIVGGGPSGCAAAVTAARMGASVFIAENSGCFGGLGTIGMVSGFCQFSDGVNWNAGGFGREIAELHQQETGAPFGRHGGFSTSFEVLKRIYDRLIRSSGAQYALYTRAIAAEAEEGVVKAVIFSGKKGLYAVKAKVFIDGTGDGDLCVWAGGAYSVGEGKKHEVMPGTLCSLWAGVDWDRVPKGHVHELLEKAVADGFFPEPDLHLPGIGCNPQTGAWGMGGGNVGHAYDLDGTNEESMTAAIMDQREKLLIWRDFYREYVPGFENADICLTADLMGVRESRRIDCEYNLSVQDFIDRAVFDDEIGRYSYPVDIHRKSDNPETYAAFLKEFQTDLRYQDGESYGIPYRCLLPKYTINLFVAGRCVGTDRAMQASIRVMPGCYITGMAAGAAAALCAEKNLLPRDLDVHGLQNQLAEMGAYLPNRTA